MVMVDSSTARKRTRLLGLGVVILVVLAGIGLWWVRRADDPPSSAAPLVEPVLYGDRILRVVDPEVGLDIDDEAQRECVLAELNRDTALVDALGDEPRASARFGDAERLAETCATAAATANDLRGILARRGVTDPNETQLNCLASALTQYPAAERDEVLRAEIADVAAGALRDKVRELVSICGLDPALVPHAG